MTKLLLKLSKRVYAKRLCLNSTDLTFLFVAFYKSSFVGMDNTSTPFNQIYVVFKLKRNTINILLDTYEVILNTLRALSFWQLNQCGS